MVATGKNFLFDFKMNTFKDQHLNKYTLMKSWLISYQYNVSDGGFEFHADEVLRSAKHLSSFQVQKFTFLFNTFFDIKKVMFDAN